MRELMFACGETIFREGSFDTTMYEILAGSVAVIASQGTPAERRLATFGVGQFFGEAGLVEYRTRSATAVAVEDGTRLREIAADEFPEFVREHPDRLLDLMRQINARLRDTTERYFDAVSIVHDAVEAEDRGDRRGEGVRRGLGRMIEAFRRASGRD